MPTEERHVVRAREDVDRVDLENAQAINGAQQTRARGCLRRARARPIEALRSERDPPGLFEREIDARAQDERLLR